jgi:hypothetical protein
MFLAFRLYPGIQIYTRRCVSCWIYYCIKLGYVAVKYYKKPSHFLWRNCPIIWDKDGIKWRELRLIALERAVSGSHGERDIAETCHIEVPGYVSSANDGRHLLTPSFAVKRSWKALQQLQYLQVTEFSKTVVGELDSMDTFIISSTYLA